MNHLANRLGRKKIEVGSVGLRQDRDQKEDQGQDHIRDLIQNEEGKISLTKKDKKNRI